LVCYADTLAPAHGAQSRRREATWLTGDRAESKGASSGRPALLVCISPAACCVRPSAIATKHAHFAFLPIFWEVRIAAGLTVDRAESKRSSSDRPTLLVSISPAACRAQSSTIATKDAHFTFLAIFALCHAPCRVTSPACLLLLPACCHLLPLLATSAAAACCAKIRPEVARVWRQSWGGF